MNKLKKCLLKIKNLRQLSNNVKNEIINKTSFLKKDSKILERIYCILNDINYLLKCEECTLNDVIFLSPKTGYRKYCSSKCANKNSNKINKTKETCIKRYGVENPFQSEKIKNKIQQTNIEKRGTKYPSQNSEVIKKIKDKLKNKNKKEKNTILTKRIKTCIKKYDVENPYQSKEIKNKIQQANLINFNTKHFTETEKFKEKSKQTCLAKYDRINFSQVHLSKNTIEKINNPDWLKNENHNIMKSCSRIAEELELAPSSVIKHFHKYNIKIKNFSFSKEEKEIIKFINIDNIETNSRKLISPYEIDIYLPEYKLAIEFNGLYWHSYDKKETPKQKKYHLTKTEMCENQNINLLHIFENEWLNPIKKEIWKSMINSKLGRNNRIFARKCEVKKIDDTKLIRKFFNENHLQGFAGSSIKIGLYYEEELVSLMTFGKSRYSKKYQYEMIRFCNKKNITIVGGASKLFKHFVRNYNPESIVSYADRRHSNGRLYEILEFKHSHDSAPNYFYFKPNENILYPRIKFQKHKLEKQLNVFDQELSEVENMFNNNYRRIWDCGNIIYYWNKN